MSQDAKKQKAKRPTAQKRMIQNGKRRLQNRIFQSRVKTAIRHFQESAKEGDQALVQDNLRKVYSLMDKGVKKGLYKLNKASRTKSRLTAKV